MRPIEHLAMDAYRDRFKAEPGVIASAPGRVNLIGEHTDYNGGFVLPFAIDRRVAIAAGIGSGEIYSADFGQTYPTEGPKEGIWVDYPRGVVWALTQSGLKLPAFSSAFTWDLPLGAGLSSSTAIEVATSLALDALFGLGLSKRDIMRLCIQAENEFVGVNTDIMDSYTSLMSQAQTVLFLDCRSLEAEYIPLYLNSSGFTLLVCNTQIKRTLGGTVYNERRTACEKAARALGIKQLRDAQETDLKKLSGEELKRARHILFENNRVLAAAAALRVKDFIELGKLMYASHASLRDDYEVSTPELDAFVDLAARTGVAGARLTGAGFGGCAIALLDYKDVNTLMIATRREFVEKGFKEPVFYTVQPSMGAELVR